MRRDKRPASSPESTSRTDEHEGSSALIRLGWMLGGTLTMLISWFTIISTPSWTFGARDAVFWCAALLTLTLRYVDVTRYQGLTSRGEPATAAHFARYAVGLLVTSCVGWTLAQSVHL